MHVKTLYILLALVFVTLPTVALSQEAKPISPAQNENINTPENFPDPKFRAAVEEIMGVGPEEPFTAEQAAQVTELNVNGREIQTLRGLKFFPFLANLFCGANQLTALNLSGNPALTQLDCSDNRLTTLDLSGNLALEYLYCSSNQLTNLNLSGNPALKNLDCFFNRLTALDLTHNPLLEILSCFDNRLTALDLSGNPALTELACARNQLTALNLSRNPALTLLHCPNNRLMNLDLSGNPDLVTLICPNNRLTTLDLSGNPALTEIDCSHNQLTSLSGFVSNPGLDGDDRVDVTFNLLGRDDCADIQTLQQRGVQLSLSPQRSAAGEIFINCTSTDVAEWKGY